MTNTKQRAQRTKGSLGVLVALCSLLFGNFALAAPCPAVGCAAGQYCARDSRLPGGSACYPTCDADAPVSGCAGGFRCITFSGQDICATDDSPLVASPDANPRCGGGRSCPSGHSYECINNECRIPNGQPCERNTQCKEGSVCLVGEGGASVCSLSSEPVADGSEAVAEQPFTSITPRLGVEIPGSEGLSAATKEGDEVVVPFLAQYVNAMYRYGVTVVLVIAIVMVVYGGFRYLVGASLGDIQAGKKIIQDALIGMLIVLGAYMILNTVNPATMNLTILRLPLVDEMQLLMGTLVETGDWDFAESAGWGTVKSSGLSFAAPPPNPYSSCPVALSNPITTTPRYLPRDSRVDEFATRMSTFARGSGPRERVLEIAHAATLCGIHMGSCGNTTITVNGMAGVSGAGNRQHTIGTDNVRYLLGINRNCATNFPGDRECKTQARQQAFERFSQQFAAEDYPNGWAATLRAGDHIWLYTAHSDGAGQHAAIFLGWAGPGRARLFNGAWQTNVRESTYCLTTDCTNVYPLTQVWSPD